MIFLCIALGCLLFQRLPLIWHMQKFGDVSGMDNLSHKLFFRLVEKNGGRIKGIRDNRFILDPAIDKGISYPLGYFKLLYLCGCSSAFFERFGAYITVFWDCCLFVLIYTAMTIAGGEHLFWLLLLPFQGILIEHMGRSFHQSERSFATFMAGVFMLALGMTAQQGWSALWLSIGILSATAALTSSKFSWQALLFIPLLASILLADSVFIAFAAVCMVSAALLSGGYAWTVLRGSTTYLRYLAGRPSRTDYYQQLLSLWSPKLNVLLWNIHHHPITALILLLPLNIVQLFASVEGPWEGIWLAGIALVFIISLPALSFLGHPARYMEFTLVPLFILLSFISSSALSVAIFSIIIIISLLSTASILRLHTWYYGADLRRKQHDETDAVRALLEDAEKRTDMPLVLVTSHRLSVKIALLSHKLRFTSFFSGVKPSSIEETHALLPSGNEHIGPNLSQYIAQYKPAYLIVDHSYTSDDYPKTGRIIAQNPTLEIRLLEA